MLNDILKVTYPVNDRARILIQLYVIPQHLIHMAKEMNK